MVNTELTFTSPSAVPRPHIVLAVILPFTLPDFSIVMLLQSMFPSTVPMMVTSLLAYIVPTMTTFSPIIRDEFFEFPTIFFSDFGFVSKTSLSMVTVRGSVYFGSVLFYKCKNDTSFLSLIHRFAK